MERAEWVLSQREPRRPSRFWAVYSSSLVVFCGGLILWFAVSGGWDESESLAVVGAFFLGLWVLSDNAGSFLHARRGAARRGRQLRALGYAVFFPLMLVSYLAAFRSGPTFLFVAESIVVGGWFVWVAVRLVRLAWRRE